MAHDAVAHDQDHGHGHGHGKDHVPHVTPLATYYKTFGALMVLTVITVAASRIDLGVTVNLILAVIIATVKATIVAALFMHLLHDSRFHAVILITSVVFLGVFVIFTMFDTNARGHAEAVERDRPQTCSNGPKCAKAGLDPWAVPTTKAMAAAPAATTAPAAPPAASPAAPAASPAAPAASPAAPAASPAAAPAGSTAPTP